MQISSWAHALFSQEDIPLSGGPVRTTKQCDPLLLCSVDTASNRSWYRAAVSGPGTMRSLGPIRAIIVVNKTVIHDALLTMMISVICHYCLLCPKKKMLFNLIAKVIFYVFKSAAFIAI